MKTIKNIFIAGVLILVPIIGTYAILDFMVGLIDSVFGGILTSWGVNSIWLRLPLSIAFVFLLGLLTKTTIGSWAWRRINSLLNRTPVIKKVYSFVGDTTKMMVEKKSFDKVVKVEFPMEGIYSIGFLTNENTNSIFVATTPNPTNGFLIFTDKYEVLDMSVEEAIKEIMSIGTIAAKTTIK